MELLNQDIQRFRTLLGENKKIGVIWTFSYAAHPKMIPVTIIRISRFFYVKGFLLIAKIFEIINMVVFGLECTPKVQIEGGLFIPHTHGIVIGAARVGKNATIYQGVTLGAKFLEMRYDTSARPTVGDNVILGSGAKILGGITIGNNVTIAANAVITKDIPDNSKVLPIEVNFTSKS